MRPVFRPVRPDEVGVWLQGSAAGFTVTPCTADGTAISADTSYDCNGDGAADSFYAGAARFTVTYAPASGLTAGDNYTIIMYKATASALRISFTLTRSRYRTRILETASDLRRVPLVR